MQLNINIPNENIAEKVLWMLEHFKSDGVEVLKLNSKNEKEILESFSQGVKELKSIRNGTQNARPVEDLLNEL